MTPKEKAKELIDKFEDVDDCEQHYNERYSPCSHQAKQCAIICVDQILNLPVNWYKKELADNNDEEYPHSATEEYWQQVKEEIFKL